MYRLFKLNSNSLAKTITTHTRQMSNFTQCIWPTLSTEEKMRIALTESDPQSAEMLYYKGMALTNMGKEFSGAAINALEKALEKDKNYCSKVLPKIADLYHEQGRDTEAYKMLKKAHDLLEQVEDNNSLQSHPSKLAIARS